MKQCKKFFSAKEFYNADEAYVVSNHTYTSSAKQLAASVGVQLIHHEELKKI
ncbi:restriction endonuclease [Pseudaeromonas sharmana]|uniref:Restriction endonuclease n=1 Tax=Pseudaeromonas sharmana TaxID=328412 RepID=A0ABV8CLL2_9GAMM